MSYPGIWQHSQSPLEYSSIRDLGAGWANYGDSLYTTGSRRTILATNREKITNNGLNSVNTVTDQLPEGIPFLWDTTLNRYAVSPDVEGAVAFVRISFQAAFTGGSNAWLSIEFDAGGGIIIWGNTVTFPRGIDIVHRFSFTALFFGSSTLLVLPGIDAYLEPSNDTDFFGFSTMIYVPYRGGF